MRMSFLAAMILGVTFGLLGGVYYKSNALLDEVIEVKGVALEPLPQKVEGKVYIRGSTKNEKIKLMIIKDAYKEWFDIKLNNGTFNEEVWLVEGTGLYSVHIMVHFKERKYYYGPTVYVENTMEVNRFLVPSKDVQSNHPKVICTANKITESKSSCREKAKMIYLWVIDHIKYDYPKHKRLLENNYMTDTFGALYALTKRKGVCYDYATLMAALGRAAGLQVKVVIGEYVSDYRQELHAWNEVYLPEENRWIPIDTAFGYVYRKNYFGNENFDEDHRKSFER